MNDDKLDKMLEKLDRIIDLLPREKTPYVPTYPPNPYPPEPVPSWPTTPFPYGGIGRTCSKCGLRLDQVMGYVCGDTYCPTFVKPTCTVSSVTYVDRHQWQTMNDEDK